MSGSDTLVESSQAQAASSIVAYDLALLLFRGIINIFFREVRPRGSFNIPREGPVIFVGAPHSNQVRAVVLDGRRRGAKSSRTPKFLDLLLALQVQRESGRRPAFLVAAKSMKRRVVGFLARSLSCSAHTTHLPIFSSG